MNRSEADVVDAAPEKHPPLHALMERAVLVWGCQWGLKGGGPKQKGKTCAIFSWKRCYVVQNGGCAVVLRHFRASSLCVAMRRLTGCCLFLAVGPQQVRGALFVAIRTIEAYHGLLPGYVDTIKKGCILCSAWTPVPRLSATCVMFQSAGIAGWASRASDGVRSS